MREREPFRDISIGLLAGWLGLFVLIPTALVVGTSFLARHPSHFVSWDLSFESYARLVDPTYLGAFTHSVGMALEATALCLVLGFPFAWMVSRMPPGRRRLLLALIIIPYWTNSLVRTYAIRSLLAATGIVNQGLMGLGLIDQPLALLYTQGAVIAGLVYLMLPFMVLPLYGVMEKLDGRLLEAAEDLGAGRWQTVRRVVIPLTLPGVIAGSLLVFLPSLGMFYVADLLGGARDLLVGNFILNQFLSARDWPFGAAASVMMIAALLLFLAAYAASTRRLGRKEA